MSIVASQVESSNGNVYGSTVPKLIDRAEIIRAVNLIVPNGQVTEVRSLDAAPKGDRFLQTFSGYFDDAEKLADAVATLGTFKAVYFVPNPVKPALLARAANRIRPAKKEPLTSDGNIESRRWLLIDADAVRESGISSTDAEHDAAIERAQQIAGDLTSQGWYAGIGADSGNGGHWMYPIDLPADDGGLVQRTLEALSKKYSDDAVKIDVTVFNPARIWKLYGTLVCKGDDTPERPHRMARIISAPDVLTPIPIELIEELAGPASTTPPAKPARNIASRNGKTFNIEEWIRDHRVPVEGPEPWTPKAGGSGRRWVLPVCPWNSDHTNRSAFIVEFPSGAIAAECHHDGCKGKDWHSLRSMYEPGWAPGGNGRAERFRKNYGSGQKKGENFTPISDEPEPHYEEELSPAEDDPRAAPVLSKREVVKPIPAGEFVAKYPEEREPVVVGFARREDVVNIVAGPKTYKSFLVAGLGLCIGNHRMWLGQFQTFPGRVLLIDNECHPETISHRIPRVASALGIGQSEWSNTMDIISLRGDLHDIGRLERVVRTIEHGTYQAIIIDAAYRTFPEDFEENSNGGMTWYYNRLDNFAKITGSALFIVHHSSKGNQSAKSVTDTGAGAGAQSRAADTHIVLRQHEEADAVVMEAVCRSWQPLRPIGLRWTYPTWTIDPDLDVTKLKRDPSKGGRPRKTDAEKDAEKPAQEPWTPARFVAEFITDVPTDGAAIRSRAKRAGITLRDADGLIAEAEAEGILFLHRKSGSNAKLYANLCPDVHMSLSRAQPPVPPGRRRTKAAAP